MNEANSASGPMYDPYLAMVAIRGQVRVEGETAQHIVKAEPEIDLEFESFDAKSELEEVAPVRRRRIEHHEFQYLPLFRRSIPTLQIRDRANHILSLSTEQRNVILLTSVDNFWMYSLYALTRGAARVLTTDEACLGDGQGPGMDDDEVPLSCIAHNLERREKALRRHLASGGLVGDASLHIGPRG
uniref:Uncharacterized protein n=1 Tax=Cannabis sativa TaxID=3483 RepID=A0A803QRC5_CANSA